MLKLLAILDRIPLLSLAIVAAMLAASPFVPEPHLIEKLRMLGQGTLTRPVDIFDLLVHGLPLVLVALKLVRMAQVRRS